MCVYAGLRACHFWTWYIPLSVYACVAVLVGMHEKGLSGEELPSPSL